MESKRNLRWDFASVEKQLKIDDQTAVAEIVHRRSTEGVRQGTRLVDTINLKKK